MGKLMTREIKEKFSVKEKGPASLATVLRYSSWTMICLEIEEEDEEIIVSIPHCASQEVPD